MINNMISIVFIKIVSIFVHGMINAIYNKYRAISANVLIVDDEIVQVENLRIGLTPGGIMYSGC
jgi:hypothetical protein